MKFFLFVLVLLFCGIFIVLIVEKGYIEYFDLLVEKWEQFVWNQLECEYEGVEFIDYLYMGCMKVNWEQMKDVFCVMVKIKKDMFFFCVEVYFYFVIKYVISINIFRL